LGTLGAGVGDAGEVRGVASSVVRVAVIETGAAATLVRAGGDASRSPSREGAGLVARGTGGGTASVGLTVSKSHSSSAAAAAAAIAAELTPHITTV
jgi:hypothetical protein